MKTLWLEVEAHVLQKWKQMHPHVLCIPHVEKTMVSMVGMSYIPQICLPPVAGKNLDIQSNLLNL